MSSVKFSANNQIQLLVNGAGFFPALLLAIHAAEHEIYLETYIFEADETGQSIKAALVQAAARGVIVNVIVDWIGTGNDKSLQLQSELQGAGIQFRIFNPWFKRGIARTHRKIVVLDRELAFLGGLNIIDDLYADDDSRALLAAPRWDIAARIAGPLVSQIHAEAASHWLRLGPLRLHERWDLLRKRSLPSGEELTGPMLAGLVVRDNLRNRRTIQRAYLQALGQARKQAILANPYFAPGRKLRDALSRAAERGIEVTLLLGVGQFRLQDAVAQSYYPALLKHGVKIVEYRKTQLHGKVAVVDGIWSTLGSSNYDGLSLFVNQEANIVVRDAAFSSALRDEILLAIADGVVVNAQDYANIIWYKRIWNGIAYLIYKNILRLISWGKYAE
jgi:cardiolipin synthase